MDKMQFFLFLLLGTSSYVVQGKLAGSKVNLILNDLADLIDSTVKNGTKILIPGIVRLTFHDCLDVCDACLNLKQVENRGLDGVIGALETVYAKYTTDLSRADFWALSAKAAFRAGVKVNNIRCSEASCKMPEIDIRFKYGRTDCPTSPTHEQLTVQPSPIEGIENVFEFFKKKFGFSPNNVVAIMGMHTLGSAKAPFNGTWEIGNEDGISNNFYKNIMDPNKCWVQELIPKALSGLPNDLFYWRTADFKGFALDTDMGLYKKFDVDALTGKSSCTYYDCPRGRTMGMFKRYAASAASWVRHIKWLFPRIIEHGYNLKHPSRT